MVVVRCWAAGGTADTMGGKGVRAWDTIEGATVALADTKGNDKAAFPLSSLELLASREVEGA